MEKRLNAEQLSEFGIGPICPLCSSANISGLARTSIGTMPRAQFQQDGATRSGAEIEVVTAKCDEEKCGWSISRGKSGLTRLR